MKLTDLRSEQLSAPRRPSDALSVTGEWQGAYVCQAGLVPFSRAICTRYRLAHDGKK